MSTLTAPPLLRPVIVRPGRGPAGLRPAAVLRTGSQVRVRWDRIGMVLVAVVVAAGLLVGGLAGTSDAETPAAAPVVVVVQTGDTVWDLARTHAPAGMSTLEYVMVVEAHNGVRSGALLPGSVLRLPQG